MADHRADTGRRSSRHRGGARRSARPARPARRRLVLGFVALALSGLTVTVLPGTLAAWNDSSTVTTGTVGIGSMDMQLTAGTTATGAVGLGTGYNAGTVAFSGLAPGETKAFNFTVANVGNPTFTWGATVQQGATWGFTNPAITVRFFTGAASAADTTYPSTETCAGTALTAAVGVTGTAQTVAPTPPATANQTVAGGSSQTGCMLIGVATSAGTENQSKTGTLRFDFTANQVVP